MVLRKPTRSCGRGDWLNGPEEAELISEKLERIEKTHGQPLAQIIRPYVEQGLSQGKVANAIGVNKKTFQNWVKNLPDVQDLPWQYVMKRQQEYNPGLTLDQWQPILEHAKIEGIESAASVYELEAGAIDAMLRGEWERVG